MSRPKSAAPADLAYWAARETHPQLQARYGISRRPLERMLANLSIETHILIKEFHTARRSRQAIEREAIKKVLRSLGLAGVASEPKRSCRTPQTSNNLVAWPEDEKLYREAAARASVQLAAATFQLYGRMGL